MDVDQLHSLLGCSFRIWMKSSYLGFSCSTNTIHVELFNCVLDWIMLWKCLFVRRSLPKPKMCLGTRKRCGDPCPRIVLFTSSLRQQSGSQTPWILSALQKSFNSIVNYLEGIIYSAQHYTRFLKDIKSPSPMRAEFHTRLK